MPRSESAETEDITRLRRRMRELAAANDALKKEIAERRSAEAALRESERSSRSAIDGIPGLVAILAPDGGVEVVNRQIVEYCGQTLEQLRNWGTNGTVHHEDLARTAQIFTQAIAAGAPYQFEHRLRRHDGVYRWFDDRGIPVRDDAGRILRWYVLLTDIDERKRAEEGLRRSEAFLAQAQRLTLTGSLWWNVATGEIVWSDETFRLMEYPNTIKPTVELIMDRVHPEDVPLVREMIGRSATEGASMDFEHRLVMPDGSVKHVHVVMQNVGLETEKFEFVGAATDITARKQAEERLRRSEAFLAAGQRLSLTGTFSWLPATGEFTWSEQLYRIYEFQPDVRVTFDLIGSRYHPDDRRVIEGVAAQARSGVTTFDYQHRLLMPNGSVKYVHVVAHGSRDPAGGGLEYFGGVQDVTQRRLAEESIDKVRSELAHVTRVMSLGALTASIAHEVNQPLSGIITNANTCLRMLGAEPPNVEGARETARRTIRDGNRAADVIARLRALFDKTAAVSETVDLNEATRGVLALLFSDLLRNRVVLRVELDDDPLLVTGDRVQLQQVILNLVRNASDAMSAVHDRPRDLLVRADREDDARARLIVKDTGVGFAPQDADRLFDAFYTTKSDGMGIGLLLSRSIIESHGGRLWAEPNEGSGATFAFSIPRLAEGAAGNRAGGAVGSPRIRSERNGTRDG
jgi:PAS domain S-box-containing protein